MEGFRETAIVSAVAPSKPVLASPKGARSSASFPHPAVTQEAIIFFDRRCLTNCQGTDSAKPDSEPSNSTHTSGIHPSIKAAYRGNDRPKPNQFIGRQSPRRRAKWQRLSMTVPSAGGTPWPWFERRTDWLPCPMADPNERPCCAAQRRIRVATKSIHRLGHRRFGHRNQHRTRPSNDPGRALPDAWEGQDPLPEGSSTDARGHKRRHMLSARRRESAPIRPVERALRGILTRCESSSYREERWG